jgi:hypothetical protein
MTEPDPPRHDAKVPNAPLTVPGLVTSASNMSTSTVNSDVTVSSTATEEQQRITLVGESQSASPTSFPTHETSSSDERSSLDSFPAAELKKGAKRTASGAVKTLQEAPTLASKTRQRRASEVRLCRDATY